MIYQLAQLTGIDVQVCREAVERVAARYRGTSLTLPVTVSGIIQEIQAGHERYMIVRYFREEVQNLAVQP